MKTLALTFAITSLAFADAAFTGLATNRDGSILYFSSSLRLKNSTQPLWPKIFVWTPQDGVKLYQQRDAGKISVGQDWGSLNSYRLFAPSISADGLTVAITAASDCNWGTPCRTSAELYSSTISFSGKLGFAMQGSAALSPNGRYALLLSSRIQGAGAAPPIWWADLQTGEKITLSARAASLRRRISNDGFIVRAVDQDNQQSIALWRPGTTKPLPSRYLAVFINASATLLVARTNTGLVAYDVATGSETTLSRDTADFATDISEDGSVAAFLNDGRLFTVRSNGTDLRHHRTTDRVVDATLSGDGRFLFAATDAARIIRLDLSTQTVDEIVPPTPYYAFSGFDSWVAPGSLLQLTRPGLTDFPDVKPYSARFQGTTWPVLNASTKMITLQVPWEMPVNNSGDFLELLLPAATETPFQPALIQYEPLLVRKQAFRWFTYTSGNQTSWLLAAHSDFSGLITPERPAAPGEMIHVYGVGFGPVTTPPLTAEPAPANPLSVVIDTPPCELGMSFESYPLHVLFPGLAPGMIGVYQIDFQLPDHFTGTSAFVFCNSGNSSAIAPLPLTPSINTKNAW